MEPTDKLLERMKTNYNGFDDGVFRDKNEIWLNFKSPNFFDLHAGSIRILPTYTDENIPSPDYADEFIRRSAIVKLKQDYKCEECGVDLTDYKKGLHTHHIDHVKGNNSFSNLMCLCALCHLDIHTHMARFITSDLRLGIDRRRSEQGMSR